MKAGAVVSEVVSDAVPDAVSEAGSGADPGGHVVLRGHRPGQPADGDVSGFSAIGIEVVKTFDVSGRWVWRGAGGHSAHLVRERSANSSSPWTLCGKRVRGPRLAWRGVCHHCRRRGADLDAEPTPARDRTLPRPLAQAQLNQ